MGTKYPAVRVHLDERQRRLWLGVVAAKLGSGGIKAIAAATGVRPGTAVARGSHEIETSPGFSCLVRVPDGGRKASDKTDPEIARELTTMAYPYKQGDLMPLLAWTTKSTRKLYAALTGLGHPVSDRTQLLAETKKPRPKSGFLKSPVAG